MVATSNVLASMSRALKLAIEQALVHASSPSQALQIALESLVEAPCMPARLKDEATELLQTCSWNDLRQTLECPPTRCDEAGQEVIETRAGSSMTHLQHFRR